QTSDSILRRSARERERAPTIGLTLSARALQSALPRGQTLERPRAKEMPMKRMLISSLLMAAFLLPGTAQTADKKLKFVMVTKTVHPYYEPCYEGFKAAAAKYNVAVDRVDPQKMELPMQVKAIEELIAQRVDGMAISAQDDAGLVPVIADATKAGIKVI